MWKGLMEHLAEAVAEIADNATVMMGGSEAQQFRSN